MLWLLLGLTIVIFMVVRVMVGHLRDLCAARTPEWHNPNLLNDGRQLLWFWLPPATLETPTFLRRQEEPDYPQYYQDTRTVMGFRIVERDDRRIMHNCGQELWGWGVNR